MPLNNIQREQRKHGIGGSDAAAVAGLSRYRTPLDVYLEKTGQSEGVIENDAMKVGHKLEPILIEAYKTLFGNEVYIPENTFIHNTLPWMMANVDGIVMQEKTPTAILECKTTNINNFKHHFGDEDSDEMPQEYLLQCAHYGYVLDIDQVDLLVFVKPCDDAFEKSVLAGEILTLQDLYNSGGFFKKYCYRRNEELEARLAQIEANFWSNHVSKNIPPPVKNANDVLLLNNPEENIIADIRLRNLIKQMGEVSEKRKELEKEEKKMKDALIAQIGRTGRVLDENGTTLCSIQKRTRKSFDSKSFKEAYASLYMSYMKESQYIVINKGKRL